MGSASLGLWGSGGVQCTGVVSFYSILVLPILGSTTSYRTYPIFLTTAWSSTSMPVMEHTLLEVVCVAIGVETSWITRGGCLRAGCTGIAFQVLKLLDFTSFEDTRLIPWCKVKEILLRLATTPPPPTARICFLLDYEGFLIGVGSMKDRWFMLLLRGPPGLQEVGIPSFPLLLSSLTLCCFPMVWHGLPLHPLKP